MLKRLEITFAVIAAPWGAARPATTIWIGCDVGAGLLLAGVLDQNAAALAIGDQRAPA